MSQTITAEHALMKYLLQNSQEIQNISKKLHVSDFKSKKNRYLFKLLIQTQTSNQKLEDGDLDPFLKGVAPKVYRSILEYINFLLKAENDKLNLAPTELIKVIKTNSFQNQIKANLQNLTHIKNPFSLPEEVMDGILDKTIYNPSKNGLLGLDTGFKQLNKDTLGFKKKELIILGARPGVGKTAFMMNVAVVMAKKNKKVAIFSLEMTYEQLYLRCLSQASRVPLKKIVLGDLSQEEMKKVEEETINLKKLFLATNDNSACSLKDIKTICKNNKIDIILIDYLQLLPDRPVKTISSQLKIIAKELNIPILCLAQLSRDVEKSFKKRKPQLSDLRDTGTIEQDADMVMFLHPTKQKEIIELLLIKNRNGINNKSYYLRFDGAIQKFSEIKLKNTDIENE
ncbi:DnaB-like helicase C-terminal domain-containing protein [Candidatus Phytoplasma solani]